MLVASFIKKLLLIVAVSIMGTYATYAEANIQKACVLDVTTANGEDESSTRNLYSAQYILEVAGMPYFTTSDLAEATSGASLILISSPIIDNTFSQSDWATIKDYVYAGGLIVAPAIKSLSSDTAQEIFGISETSTSKDANLYYWNIQDQHPELRYFDEPEEQSVSLSRSTGKMQTTKYTPTTAVSLAHYNSPEKTAVTKNQYGEGIAYAFGVQWSEVIQRNHLNQDYNACRTKDNGLEISGDAYPFFVRSAYVSHLPVSSWKYTVPKGYLSVLIPTHDCDSRTALDEMHWIAEYEASIGLRAHFFITTHYFRNQGYMSAFYNEETIPAAKKLVEQGHTIGSHSICHFPDFNIIDRFPMTEYTKEEYAEYATRDLDAGVSQGSTWAEIVLSKMILEEDLGVKVSSFRSGHLCVNNNFPEAHQQGGYTYSSCYNSNDVLSQFPFIQRMENDWKGAPSGALQIPIHFSDVFKSSGGMNEENWFDLVDSWQELYHKYAKNYGVAVLLVHPNRDWKMMAQRELINRFDPEFFGTYNFEDYGRFWNNRRDFDYEISIDPENNTAVITSTQEQIMANADLGIAVEMDQGAITTARILDEYGNDYACHVKKSDTDRMCIIVLDKIRSQAPRFITTDETVERGDKALIASDQADAEIYYSTDGETPVLGANRYVDGVTITHDMIVSAIACTPGFEPSDVQSRHFSIFHPVGDANGDNNLDATDIGYAIDKILGTEQPGFLMRYADIDLDGRISIYDAVSIVDLALDNLQASPMNTLPQCSPFLQVSDGTSPSTQVIIKDLTGNVEAAQCDIALQSATDIKGFECELELPDGLSLDSTPFTLASALSDFELYTSYNETTKRHKIVVLSPTRSDKEIQKDAVLLTIHCSIDSKAMGKAINLSNFYAVSAASGQEVHATDATKVVALTTIVPTEITVSKAPGEYSSRIEIGDQFSLSVDTKPENASQEGLEWSSDNEEVATIDHDGRFTAWKNGDVRIYAKIGDVEGSRKFTVSKSRVYVEWPEQDTIACAGQSIELLAYCHARREYEEGFAVKYDIILGSDCAKIEGSTLYMQKAGEIKVEASPVAPNNTYTIVNSPTIVKTFTALMGNTDPIPATEIKFSNKPSSMVIGDTITVVANVLPSDTTYPIVSWASSDPEVATIDENGLITAIAKTNSVKITASCGDVVNSFSFPIYKKTQNVTWDIDSVLRIGQTYPCNASSDSGLPLKYKITSGEEIAVINDNDEIATLSQGYFTLRLYNDGNDTWKSLEIYKDFLVTSSDPSSILSQTIPTLNPQIIADGNYAIVSGIPADMEIAIFAPDGRLAYRGKDRRINLQHHRLYICHIQGISIKFTTK